MASREPQAILTVVTLESRPSAVDAVTALMQALALDSVKERGCTRFEVLQQVTEPTRFFTIERWDGDAAADAHMRTPHVRAALERLGPLLSAEPRFVRYRSVERA